MKIIGTGCSHPSKIVTNEMLANIVNTSDEWITSRTGIKERCVISSENLEDLAIDAARKALDNAGISATELDYIICANVVNEFVTPALSCIIQGALGAKCPCIDLNGACVGFVYALDIAEAYYHCGKAKNILIVCAEEPSRMLSWEDRSVCVLFGDGAGAAVLSEGDNIKATRLTAASNTDKLYQKHELQPSPFVTKPNSNLPLVMKGQDVFKFAVYASIHDLQKLLNQTGHAADQIDKYILHQANIRIIETVSSFLKQPIEKFPMNIEKYGNTSSASVPILLDELNRSGQLKKGELLAISAFGAGFVSGACIMEW
jgi:3-oxoacyl-(acyl-carrier-protein) synthase III